MARAHIYEWVGRRRRRNRARKTTPYPNRTLDTHLFHRTDSLAEVDSRLDEASLRAFVEAWAANEEPRPAQVIRLRVLEGKSYEEVATQTGIRADTVRTIWRRAFPRVARTQGRPFAMAIHRYVRDSKK